MRFIVDECKNILNNSANLSKHFELITSHPTLAKFFMEQVGLKVDRVDLDGNSLLSSIVIYNETSKAVFDYLIAKGADVNLKEQSSKTPLMITYEKSYNTLAKLRKMQLLLQHGASITNKMKNGATLLDVDPDFSKKLTSEFHIDYVEQSEQALPEINVVELRRKRLTNLPEPQ